VIHPLLLILAALDGGVSIEVFKTPTAALREVMRAHPVMLGVGEYHELKGAPTVRSAIKRFTTELLPSLDGGATSLIVETWMLSGKCGQVEKQATKAVEKVTQRPKETEDEVTTLLTRSYDLGLKNHILVINCDDYRSMLDADGELDAERSLILVRRKIEGKAIEVREKGEGGVPGKTLLLYGGALHNDLQPKAIDAEFSFGPALQAATDGGYVELDLLVPEYVEKDPDLLELPWFATALKRSRQGHTVLVRPSPGVNVVLFAFTPRRRSPR